MRTVTLHLLLNAYTLMDIVVRLGISPRVLDIHEKLCSARQN